MMLVTSTTPAHASVVDHLWFKLGLELEIESQLELGMAFLFVFVLFAIFILHSRESELYRYALDGKSALAYGI